MKGSSPRVWGQVVGAVVVAQREGIIPTRVGTRKTTHADTRTDEDHPHACGDKLRLTENCYRSRGSSPRVWGQVLKLPKGRGQYGIIPTRVGTSATSFITSEYNEDHPHACGDKLRRV